MRHLKRIIRLLPVLMMMGIAALHMFLVVTMDLSPWRIGGFGMFSSIDNVSTRFVRAHLRIGDELQPLDLSSYDKVTQRLRVLPSKHAFERLLHTLVCEAPELTEQETEVTLRFWTASFDMTSSTMTPRLQWQSSSDDCQP